MRDILRMVLFWPIALCLVWYAFSFETAGAVAFLYVHVMLILLYWMNKKTQDALVILAKETGKLED